MSIISKNFREAKIWVTITLKLPVIEKFKKWFLKMFTKKITRLKKIWSITLQTGIQVFYSFSKLFTLKTFSGYQQQQAQKNSENEYKKKYEKTKAENKFNACETITYNDQKKKKVILTKILFF